MEFYTTLMDSLDLPPNFTCNKVVVILSHPKQEQHTRTQNELRTGFVFPLVPKEKKVCTEDLLAKFITDCCKVKAGYRVSTVGFLNAFLEWSGEECTSKCFVPEMKNKGFVKKGLRIFLLKVIHIQTPTATTMIIIITMNFCGEYVYVKTGFCPIISMKILGN